MKIFKISLSAFALILGLTVNAQTKAITETGVEVLLFDNGSWQFANKADAGLTSEVRVNKSAIKKNKDATFLVKSTKIPVGVYLNPNEWKFRKSVDNEDAEYEFQHKELDIYGLLIPESTQIPIETLKGIALDNARTAAPDIVIDDQEYCTVNDNYLLMMQLKGSVQGIKIIYRGFYYSNEHGTVQLIMYTGQNMLSKVKPVIENFMSGFVTLEK